MKKKIKLREVSVIIMVTAAVLTCIFCYRQLVTETMSSIDRCIYSVIPSLYAPMFTACLITESNLHNYIGKIFSPVSRFIFKMPPEIFAVFLLSNVSGYPSGIKLLEGLRKKGRIDDDEFNRYSLFCFSAGPAFVAGVVSSGLFSCVNVGLIIFISTFTANMIIAFILGIGQRVPETEVSHVKIKADIIIRSARNAASGMLHMCTMITAFALIKVLLCQTGALDAAADFLNSTLLHSHQNCHASLLSILEITNISQFRIYSLENIPVITALFSFGGICVVSQISSISEGRLKLGQFIFYRIFSSVVSYFISLILCKIFIKNVSMPASTFEVHSSEQSIFPSLILLLMSIMLMIFTSSKQNSRLLLSHTKK